MTPVDRAADTSGLLYIFGAGGHGRELAWLAETIYGDTVRLMFAVDQPQYLREPVNGVEVMLLSEIEAPSNAYYVVALGDPVQRRRCVAACESMGLLPATLIHPRVEMSEHLRIGSGSVLCAGVVVTTNVSIGRHVHINICCSVSHDACIDDFATLSPGVHVSGNVRIGKDVFIGTGANIINGSPGEPLVIGDGAIIAAGACVTHNVEAGTMVAGVPANRKK